MVRLGCSAEVGLWSCSTIWKWVWWNEVQNCHTLSLIAVVKNCHSLVVVVFLLADEHSSTQYSFLLLCKRGVSDFPIGRCWPCKHVPSVMRLLSNGTACIYIQKYMYSVVMFWLPSDGKLGRDTLESVVTGQLNEVWFMASG